MTRGHKLLIERTDFSSRRRELICYRQIPGKWNELAHRSNGRDRLPSPAWLFHIYDFAFYLCNQTYRTKVLGYSSLRP